MNHVTDDGREKMVIVSWQRLEENAVETIEKMFKPCAIVYLPEKVMKILNMGRL